MDYLEVGNLTKINVTEILETTYIQFTGLKDKAIVSLLSGIAEDLGVLNKPIYLSDFLKNIEGLLKTISGFLPEGVVIPPGSLGLDNLTQFLPLAYEYFEGMYWSDIRNKAEFSLVIDNETTVNAIGKVIDCSETPSSGLVETIPIDNYIFSNRNNLPDMKGIYVIDGFNKKVYAKVNCSDYPQLLPESMRDLNCYLKIKYDAKYGNYPYTGYTSVTITKFKDITPDKNRAVITVEPRDETALSAMKTIAAVTDPDIDVVNVCGEYEYNSFIDLSNVEEDKKYEERIKVLENVYESLSKNISSIYGRIYLNYTNIKANKTGLVNLKKDGLEDIKVWTTTSSPPEMNCNFVFDGSDDDGDGSGGSEKPTSTSDMSSSISISYLFGLIIIILAFALM